MTSAEDFGSAIREQLVRHRREVEDLYAGRPRASLGWLPAPGVWSVAECLQHLVITDGHYLELTRASLARARGTALQSAVTEVRGGPVAGWFVRQVGPDGKRRVQAPGVFQPGEVEVPEAVPESFLASQDRLVQLLDESLGFDLDRVRVPSPVSGIVRFRLGDVFRVICAHQRRHLDQAARIWNDPRREAAP
jgi:hypothetical protein